MVICRGFSLGTNVLLVSRFRQKLLLNAPNVNVNVNVNITLQTGTAVLLNPVCPTHTVCFGGPPTNTRYFYFFNPSKSNAIRD